MNSKQLIKTNVEFTNTKSMDYEQWLEFRLDGLGCSDMGTVMNLNKWESPVELFHKKLGLIPQKVKDNPAMFWGRRLEDQVAIAWQYWEWKDENKEEGFYIENAEQEKVIRKCVNINYYMRHPEHKWLFGSPDRLIVDGPGILEIKTISGFSADQYESGVPDSYIIQIQAYMLLTGLQFAEMAILKDGRDLQVIRFERNETIIQSIIEWGTMFWELIEQAKEMLTEGASIDDLHDIEPDYGRDTDAYHHYQKSRYDSIDVECYADEEMEVAFDDYIKYKAEEKSMGHKKRDAEILIKDFMKSSEKLVVSDKKYITWKANKNGSRVFRVTNK